MHSKVTTGLPTGGWTTALVLILISVQVGQVLGQTAGSVAGWGANESMQAQAPASLADVVQVAAGQSHSVALKSDGTILCWGSNSGGETTTPAGLSQVTAIAAGSNYSLALTSDGLVHVWGELPPAPANLSNVVELAAGTSHALARCRDGTIVAWGTQSKVPPGATNVVAISAGNGQSMALRGDGTVVAWGDDSYGKAEVPAGLTNVVAIAAGGAHCLALRGNGTVVGWGRNDSGQAAIPAGLANAVAIRAGALHSLALRADGSLVAWGDDTDGQVSSTPAGIGFVGIAAGAYHNLAIEGDGRPVIVVQPASQRVPRQQTATFQVLAVGTAPLGYQWQKTGTNLTGATDSVLVLTNAQGYNEGFYAVIVSNQLGAVTSQPAFLTVSGLRPQFISSPQDTNLTCGDSLIFQVTAKGPSLYMPLYYQWSFQGVPIEQATHSSLTLTNISPAQAGVYTIVVTDYYGSTSASAQLSVQVQSPLTLSPMTASATQGLAFSYTVPSAHSPTSFSALFLPPGLNIDTNSGVVSGIPLESGTFGPIITAVNQCTSGSAPLLLNIASSAPNISTAANATGTEGAALTYQITASGTNLSYSAQNLPPGLSVDPASGLISGTPVLAGDYDTAISISNQWGIASATVHFIIVNAPVSGLSIGNVNYNYSSPYLLDFSFTLLDNNDPTQGTGVIADPGLLSTTCFEDIDPISPSETGAFISRTSKKVIKAYLVLDFTQSIASLANGDTNQDGISDAVDNLVSGAIAFVNEQSVDTQVGVYEFHREDMDPAKVIGLTTDKRAVDNAIAGIWTNYVQGFPAGSRCWDALMGAVNSLGAPNRDEEHFVILVSDGRDESSTNQLSNVIAAAAAGNIQVFAVGFGNESDPATLQSLAIQTQGRYFQAQSPGDIARQFAQISKLARGQYILRWATLKRSVTPFMPSFQVTYQGLTANSPTNPFTLGSTNIDNTTTPPTTNITPAVTNFIIGYYSPGSNAGPVLVGSLRFVPNAEVQPTGLDLRATYVPRYIRQLHLHYRANWPCTAALQSTGPGEWLEGWTMVQTNDGAGGVWLLLSSPYPLELTNSLPFASFGKLVTFAFADPINASNAFSVLEVDNSIYTNTGGQSFVFENTNSVLSFYPALPHGTPIPWLMSFGFTGDFTNAELLDSDNDGMANWQEFRANTNPTNAASVFLVRTVAQQADGRYQVTFSSSTNRLYRVEASDDLSTWRIVQDMIPGVNQDITVTDLGYVPAFSNIFYRVLVW